MFIETSMSRKGDILITIEKKMNLILLQEFEFVVQIVFSFVDIHPLNWKVFLQFDLFVIDLLEHFDQELLSIENHINQYRQMIKN